MNCNFYQIAYSIETLKLSHPSFKIFNQVNKPLYERRETSHMINFFDSGLVKDDGQFYALVSPRFIQKLKINFHEILSFIEKHKFNDLLLLNTDPKWSYFYFNLWNQGECFHKGIINTAEYINKYKKNTIDFNSRHDVNNSLYSNYWIAKYPFWKRYIEYLKKINKVIDSLPEKEKKLFFLKAENHTAPMYTFILERMLSNYLIAQKDINFISYKYSRKAIINSATSLTDKILLSKYIDIIDKLDDIKDKEKLRNLITQINTIRKTIREQNSLQRLISNVNLFFE